MTALPIFRMSILAHRGVIAGVGYLAFLMMSLLSISAFGHHSYIRIDRDSVVAFEATVLQFEWRNPHVYFRVETVDENGERVEWQIETGSTPILAHSGWSEDSLETGDVISVRAHPERGTDRRYAVLQSLTTQDGTVLMQGIRASEATETTPDINGVWKSRLEPGAPIEVLSALFAEFMTISLTRAGQASIATYDHDRDNPTAICNGYGLLAGLTSPHYLNEIELLDDRVIIRDEWFDGERIIYTDGREHPFGGERARLGHSVGHWDGDTLVVETGNFTDKTTVYGSGMNMKVTEKFARINESQIEYSYTVEDPESFTAPWSARLPIRKIPDALFEYACHEANYSREYMLKGARILDAEAEVGEGAE